MRSDRGPTTISPKMKTPITIAGTPARTSRTGPTPFRMALGANSFT